MVANNTINFPSNQPANKQAEAKSTVPTLTPETLQKFDVSGPRYTSYPTADRFVEAFTEESYKQTLAQRRIHHSANLINHRACGRVT